VRLEWAPLAIADRESIFDYIAPENLDAALVRIPAKVNADSRPS
jgi:plasmid stabilization system protein ParE